MALSNPVKDLRRPNLSNSTWRGKVVDNNDPEKRQRVKIRIPQLHRGIPDDMLPWVMPSSAGYAHAGSGVGSVDIPPEGSLLEMYFEEDDPHNPRYGGSPPVDSVNKENEILNEDYPKTRGYVDEAGNKWTVNTQRNEVLFQHKSGASIFVDGSGNISVTAKSKLSFNAPSGIDIVSNGNVNIHAAGVTDIKGNDVLMNGSSAAKSSANPSSRSKPSIPSSKGKTDL